MQRIYCGFKPSITGCLICAGCSDSEEGYKAIGVDTSRELATSDNSQANPIYCTLPTYYVLWVCLYTGVVTFIKHSYCGYSI
jgi:hypothetical protein